MPSLRSEPPGRVFTELFRAHFRYVYIQLRRLGVPTAAVDDAVQEVFLVVLRRHDEAPVVYVRGWLFAIVRRIAHRHRRGAQRLHRLQHALASEPAAPGDAHTTLAQRQAARLLGDFLDRLADERREVFVLAELEQMTAPEIARALGIKENTVSSRLRAARQEFDRNFARVRLRERRITGQAATDERALLLSHARRADDPTPAARQRAWLVLLAHPDLHGLGLAPEAPLPDIPDIASAAATNVPASLMPGTLATADAASKLSAWAVAIGLGGALVIAAGHARRPASEPDAPAHASLAAPRADRQAAPTQPAPQRPAASDPPSSSTTAAPAVAPRRLREAKPTAADLLQAEAALMAEARAAIRRGDPSAAQALLLRHAQEFPAGALVDERELSGISVLCALGQRDAARRAAGDLARARPGSALARRADELCREETETEIQPAGD